MNILVLRPTIEYNAYCIFKGIFYKIKKDSTILSLLCFLKIVSTEFYQISRLMIDMILFSHCKIYCLDI